MNDNEKLIHHFYNSFKQKDYAEMQKCYADNATFSDEAFQNLNSAQVKAMWKNALFTRKRFGIKVFKRNSRRKKGLG